MAEPTILSLKALRCQAALAKAMDAYVELSPEESIQLCDTVDALRTGLDYLLMAASRARQVMRAETGEEVGVLVVLAFQCDGATALLATLQKEGE